MVKTLGILVDNSGSMIDMNPIETVQSLNKNIQTIANEDTSIFVAKFSDEYEVFVKNKKKGNVKIERKDIEPDGLTALYDGIGSICSDINEACSGENDVTIIILTDGAENASQKETKHSVKKLLSQKQELGWKFVFLGANQDAITTGNNLGISGNSCCTYSATPGGLEAAMRNTSNAINRYRDDGEEINFTQEERHETANS